MSDSSTSYDYPPSYEDTVSPKKTEELGIYRIVSNENPPPYHSMPRYRYDTRDEVIEWNTNLDSKRTTERPKKEQQRNPFKKIVRKIFV